MGKSPTRPGIDMAYVYGELDKGRTVESVAKELKISRRTLYRCHDMYQAQVPENEKRCGLTDGRGNGKKSSTWMWSLRSFPKGKVSRLWPGNSRCRKKLCTAMRQKEFKE